MSENDLFMEKSGKILEMFKTVIRFGVTEGIDAAHIIGMLRAFADSIQNQNEPLEWWIEHKKGLN